MAGSQFCGPARRDVLKQPGQNPKFIMGPHFVGPKGEL